MIKQIITTTTLIAAAAAMANAAADANTLLVKIGSRDKPISELWNPMTGGNMWNYIHSLGPTATTTWDSSTTSSTTGIAAGLKMADGSASTYSITAYSGFGGDGAKTTGGFAGDTTLIESTFGVQMDWLNTRGGVAQREGDREQKLTIGGLTAGQQYSLTVLLGRGNSFGESSTYSLGNATGVSINILDQEGTEKTKSDDGLSLLGNTRGSENIATNWALASFSFVASGTTVDFLDTTGRLNVSTIKFSAIPEPSMFGLLAGLGALALVGARRRRK